MQPVYDDPARPVAEGIYRSGGCTAAYLVLTDHGRIIVNAGMGFEAPHHKRVFDADPAGSDPLHRHHAGPRRPRRRGGPLQAGRHRLRGPAEQPAVPGRRRPHPSLAHAHRGDLVRHAGNRRAPHRHRKPRRVDAPGRTGARHHVRPAARARRRRPAPGTARSSGGDDRQCDHVAARAPHRADQQSLRAPLPPFPEPQHPAGGPLPLRRALSGERAHRARPPARGPHHGEARPDRRRRPDRRQPGPALRRRRLRPPEGPRGVQRRTSTCRP